MALGDQIKGGRGFASTSTSLDEAFANLLRKTPKAPSTSALGQTNQGSQGGSSLASGQNAAIFNGETNKFAGTQPTGISVAEGILRPTITSPKPPYRPTGDLVDQALSPSQNVPQETARLGASNALNPNRLLPSEDLRAGQGALQTASGTNYTIQDGQVTKFDAQGNPQRLGGIVSYIGDQSLSSQDQQLQHEINMKYAHAGYAYDPAQRAIQIAQENAPQRYIPSAVSDFEKQTALRAATRGSNVQVDKLRLADLAARDQAGNAIRASISQPGLSADQQIKLAGLLQTGGIAAANLQQKQSEAAQKQDIASRDLELRKQTLSGTQKQQLGQSNLNIAKLNQLYDESIRKASTENPEAIPALHSQRSTSLVRTSGSVDSALASDPEALRIINTPGQNPATTISLLDKLYPGYGKAFSNFLENKK